MKEIIKDYEGEVWCISKHLLAASMRLMEVGTKELKKGHKDKAWGLFDKSYKLYSLFWGLNLGVVETKEIDTIPHFTKAMRSKESNNVDFINDSGNKTSVSILSKLGSIVQKAINCCRE